MAVKTTTERARKPRGISDDGLIERERDEDGGRVAGRERNNKRREIERLLLMHLPPLVWFVFFLSLSPQ